MDPEVSLLLHCAHWKGLRKCQVQVELSERYNRQTDPALEEHIEKLWKERLAKEPWIFNGAKFRLHSFSLACHKNSEAEDTYNKNYKEDVVECNTKQGVTFSAIDDCVGNRATALASKESRWQEECVLTLRLGLTNYKDYLGTNWSGQAEELCRRGEMEFDDALSLLAQPLGVGAILCTVDEQIVFIRRSQRVAEAGGLLDIPGGHPEPKAVCENLGLKICEEKISLVMLGPVAVVTELFSSVCAEIRDEINIPLNFLGEPLLIGIALNHTSAGRPSAEFYISCSLTSDQVKRLYLKGGAEANESTDIIFVSKKTVLQLDQTSNLWPELCPSAKGAVLLYQTVKPDTNGD
ncbi:uridine diphosphate glucose pyrophosphatase NUDT22 [Periophthalmus magnuspinnatus]|uniref:uridine diphosphate glucose pyrophosphatase NUDT22 n=1 Tax=Periophthalmus magnuspinnatus TaxID=409849 RepID=UPI00145A1E8E|nr:uridine diphosphate glucose pyrophosphatase NUDT22 [Periophthalmus magnuspinnatus]